MKVPNRHIQYSEFPNYLIQMLTLRKLAVVHNYPVHHKNQGILLCVNVMLRWKKKKKSILSNKIVKKVTFCCSQIQVALYFYNSSAKWFSCLY